MCSHLFISLISFIKSQFSVYRSLSFSDKFISKYFICYWCYCEIFHFCCKGIQLIYVYFVSCDFIKIVANIFWLSHWDFQYIKSHHLQIVAILLLPFQCVWLFFVLLNCSGWTSSTILNRSGESRHPYLVPNFRGRTFIFFFIEYNVSCRIAV